MIFPLQVGEHNVFSHQVNGQPRMVLVDMFYSYKDFLIHFMHMKIEQQIIIVFENVQFVAGNRIFFFHFFSYKPFISNSIFK